ncbi:armadillo-type protein [Mycena capillaripes]|nr:armadillo-type protein [Mycena capillaripes]
MVSFPSPHAVSVTQTFGCDPLLLHAGKFMRDNFLEAADTILTFRANRDPTVRHMVMSMIPTLANYNTQVFQRFILHKAMPYLVVQLDKVQERDYVNGTSTDINGRPPPPLVPHLTALGLLVAALGYVLLLLSRLLLTFTVMPDSYPFIFDREAQTQSQQPQRPGKVNKELLTLALTTLGTFDFSGRILAKFAQTNVLRYIKDESAQVRRAAAHACFRLLSDGTLRITAGLGGAIGAVEPSGVGGMGMGAVNRAYALREPLGRLLKVGITDPDPTVRNIVLRCLNEQFDQHLSEAENVESLFIALSDRVFENRVTAARVIGRLAKYNPVYVLPALRKTLVQLMGELDNLTAPLNCEESIWLLIILVHNTQLRLIRPYVFPMFATLFQKAIAAPPG